MYNIFIYFIVQWGYIVRAVLYLYGSIHRYICVYECVYQISMYAYSVQIPVQFFHDCLKKSLSSKVHAFIIEIEGVLVYINMCNCLTAHTFVHTYLHRYVAFKNNSINERMSKMSSFLHAVISFHDALVYTCK